MEESKMDNLSDMIWVEVRKVLRSRMPLFTLLGSFIMPLGIGFLIFLAKHPSLSKNLGLVSAKANLTAYFATDWPTYMGFSGQIIAAGGFFLFTFAISWVFGREFADGTLKDMLAVPVSRKTILLAKFIVVAAWSALLTIVILLLSLITGAMINLPQGSLGIILQGSAVVVITACMVIAIVFPFALFASVGRGYLLPMGVAILSLILANLVVVLGWGEYFPWSVPGLFAQGKSALAPISYLIVLLTGLVGIAGTYLWWKFADQSR
jgi:ABC-2 type transport system permease protein